MKQIKLFTWIALGLLLGLYLVANLFGYGSLLPGYHAVLYTPAKYRQTIDGIFRQRDEVRMQYKTAFVEAQRDEAIRHAGKMLTNNIESQIFPYWYGTAYDFNGNTDTPGKGKVACGYFVTTVLHDAGIPINRNTLAQVASEELVKGLVGEPHTHRFSALTIGEFLSELKAYGEGLYVVGLDTHTGFLLYQNGQVDFIHASARWPEAVVREPAVDSPTLRRSNYRVIGKISDNYGLMSAWLNVTPSTIVPKSKRLRGSGLLPQ